MRCDAYFPEVSVGLAFKVARETIWLAFCCCVIHTCVQLARLSGFLNPPEVGNRSTYEQVSARLTCCDDAHGGCGNDHFTIELARRRLNGVAPEESERLITTRSMSNLFVVATSSKGEPLSFVPTFGGLAGELLPIKADQNGLLWRPLAGAHRGGGRQAKPLGGASST